MRWLKCSLNYAKIKIKMTSQIIQYIYKNYMKISSKTVD